MALFEKRPLQTSGTPAYTIGAHKTVLVLGLGNPGKDYDGTRHNVGAAILDTFASSNDFPSWTLKADLGSTVSVKNLGETRVVLAKPTTFMNDSGRAAAALQRFYRIGNSETLAVYDELAIEFGQLRARIGGSDAGHNGVKSLIQHLDEDFGRLRVGIGNDKAKLSDSSRFVLAKFSQPEQGHLGKIKNEAAAMITEYIFGGRLPHDTRKVL